MDQEEMMHVFRINTVGPLLVVQQLLKRKLIGAPAALSSATSREQGRIGGRQRLGEGLRLLREQSRAEHREQVHEHSAWRTKTFSASCCTRGGSGRG